MDLKQDEKRLHGKMMRNMIQDALDVVAAKHGCESITLSTAVYVTKKGNMRFNLDVVIEGGMSREAERYERWEDLIDLPPLGSELALKPNGPLGKIVGINTTQTKIFVKIGEHRHAIPRATVLALVKLQEGE